MKIIKYQLLTEVNLGTEDEPNIHQTLSAVEMPYTEANYQLALSDAYQGQIIIEDVEDTRPISEQVQDKEQELSQSCNQAITAGIDVTTTKGIEHFSLEETDQINLTIALASIQNGATSYPYHADGELCRMFTGKEIQDISNASIQHKIYHTTLCNHLLTWARRATTASELEQITYSAENLPEDLAANMISILAQGQT